MARLWSWAALVVGILVALVVLAFAAPTFGGSLALSLLAAPLTLVAAFVAPRDAVFWIGLVLNALLLALFGAWLVALIVG